MKLFHRKDVPPPDALALLSKDERVVSWADTVDGSVVLATPAGLWWPSADGLRRIGWQFVDKAVWRDGRLVVIEAEVVDDVLLVDLAPVAVELSVPRDLPPTVRKRVEGNVAHSQVLPVPGGEARFVARKIPGANGLIWRARLEDGTPRLPDTLEVVEATIDYLREQWAARRNAST